jgi:hypothetical protein
MHNPKHAAGSPFTFMLLSITLLLFVCSPLAARGRTQQTTAATASATPSDAVRQFYRALSEKRFRDALMMSVYAQAIEGLSNKDLDDLRPDFENLAVGAEKVEVKGEQVSGDSATVFVKLKDDEAAAPPLPVQMRRVKGNWIIYDEDVERAVKKEGNKYFFNARIKAHEEDVQNMLVRVAQAQLVYSAQHGGVFADLQTLVKEKLVPDDILGSQSTGYNFRVTLSGDRKSYTAGAEPAVYGRTGTQSFFMDPKGIQKSDMGGKPYAPKK